jgi:adenine/guanine phosphoribosyltransferase-like PRPP-binding protein
MLATKRLVEQTGAQVIGAVTLVNLEYLNKGLDNLPVVQLYGAKE